MDTKRVYEIIEDVDHCLLKVMELRRIIELLQAGFEAKNEKYGVYALNVINDYLQDSELALDKIHGKLDKYELLKNM